jgi:hydrogenase maturation protease
MSTAARALVIGVGNSWAGDDAAGIVVARALRGRLPAGVALIEHEGEPTALLDRWDAAGLAVVVDATSGGGPAGAVRTFDATDTPLPAGMAGTSTHAFSVAQAVELARTLGRLPRKLVVVGIEGRSFEAGAVPGPAVMAAVNAAADEVLECVERHLRAKDRGSGDA